MATSPIVKSNPVADLLPTEDFNCSLCGVKFSQQEYLTNHLSVCKDIQNPSHILATETATVKHEDSEDKSRCQELVESHKEIKPIFQLKLEETKCTGSTISDLKTETVEELSEEETAAQSPQLKENLREHSGEKTFKCTVCDYTSSRHALLKSHMRTHTREKPFKCTICDNAFAHSTTLTLHMRKHTGEKPFKCTICDCAFALSAQLTLHMRKHTGEKPFKCTICEYAFARSSDFKRHMRIHTGEKLSK